MVIDLDRDLTIESFRDPKDKIYITGTHRINAVVIDAPTKYIMIFPKELPCAALGCAIMNGLESQNPNSNIIWRIG